MSPSFAPGVDRYTVDVNLLVQSVRVSATPLEPATMITIDGAVTDAGALSAPRPLNLGSNTIAVVGTSPSGERATYSVELTRAGQLVQAPYLTPPTSGGDVFGSSVAISGDTLAIGARTEASSATGIDGNDADTSAPSAGAAFVFVWSGSAWTQQTYIKASNTEAFDYFGSSVALSNDTLVVSAVGEDSSATGIDGNQADNGATDSGAVYVFTRTGTAWSQQAYIKASNTDAGDSFGGGLDIPTSTIALSGDTLVVGAYREASGATGVGGNQADNSATNAGAAYVFTRVGTTWSQQAYLKASNTQGFDQFGCSVALSASTLAVSACLEDSAATGIDGNQADEGAADAGAVYVFTLASGSWSQEAYVKASNTGAGDLFGTTLALSDDTLVVGAFREDSAGIGVGGNQNDESATDSGAAYVFTRTGTSWSQQAYVKASNTDPVDNFGYSLALLGDTLAIGAIGEDSGATGIDGNQSDNSAIDSGAVYVFARIGAAWAQQAYLKASNTASSAAFGNTVALSSDTLVVGAWQDAGIGAVYVFR